MSNAESTAAFLLEQYALLRLRPGAEPASDDGDSFRLVPDPGFLSLRPCGYGPERRGGDAWLVQRTVVGDPDARATARGLFVVGMGIPAEYDIEFNAWYDTEHMPLLVDVEGVVCGVRYRSLEPGPPEYWSAYYFAREAVDVMNGAEWLAATETPWTRRIRRVLARQVTAYGSRA